MNKRILLFLVAAILILSTAAVMAMEPSVDTFSKAPTSTEDEVTVTDLKNVNTNSEEAKKKINVNSDNKKASAEEAAPTRGVVDRKKTKKQARGDQDSLDFWFNRPRTRFNRLFKNLFSDDDDTEEDEDNDLFGSMFKNFFGPFGRRGRRGSSGRKPISSLLSSIFDDDHDDEDIGSNKLLGGWEDNDRWPILREPSNLLNSFSKMFQDFKRREKDEWKENPEAYELRVKLPEGMKKENVQIEIEKDEDEAGRHTLLIHGKAEKHEEVKKEAPKEATPQLQDSGKQEQPAEEKKSDQVATSEENKAVSATRFETYKKVDQVSELERRYVIPATVDTEKVSAEIQDGNMLVITLGKKAEAIKRKQKVAVNIQ